MPLILPPNSTKGLQRPTTDASSYSLIFDIDKVLITILTRLSAPGQLQLSQIRQSHAPSHTNSPSSRNFALLSSSSSFPFMTFSPQHERLASAR